MAIEQTLFSIQRSVLQPEAVPALFSQYQWLLSDLFYNSDCTSCRNVNSALPLGIQFQDNISLPLPEFWNESTSNGVTPV